MSASETALARRDRGAVAYGSRGIEIQTLDDAWRLAEAFHQSGLCPASFKTPQAVLVAFQAGAELGLTPFSSLQLLTVISGKVVIGGDGALALVKGSPVCEYVKPVRYEGTPGTDDYAAIVESKRAGDTEPYITRFSIADAKKAGLWAKPGPWQQYGPRMLYYRALGFNLRDAFPDVLRGIKTAEEIRDYPTDATEPRSVTPIRAVEDQPDDAQPPARKNAVTTEQLQQIAAEAARAGVIPDEVSAELHGMPVMELQTGNAARLLEHLRTLPAAIDADEAASAVEEPAEPAPAEELPDPFERGQTEPVPGEAERAAEQAERREAEGRAIAAMGHVTKKGRRYEVKSGRDKTYHVTKPGKHLQCDCADFAYGGAGKPGYRCKHAWSVVYHAKGAGATDTVGGQPISEREAADLRSAFEERGVNAAEWLRAHGIASGLAGDATVEVFDAAMAELFN
jgi:hypothetical protein